MKRTRVKFCGMTREADVKFAAEIGVDAIGVILHAPGSPREIDLPQAGRLFNVLPPFVARVGVFLDADSDTILDAADRLFLDYAQLHGEPNVDLIHDICAVKLLLSVPADERLRERVDEFTRIADKAQLSLALDSGLVGGSGKETDWDRLSDLESGQLADAMIAGGVHPGNVQDVIERFSPGAVDVSSGIEDGVKGFKDIERMRAFVRAVRAADRNNDQT